MKKFLKEFKEFAMQGNVLDLAVGMMIGSAFGKIVSSLVSDILTPLISGIFRIPDFTGLKVLLVDHGSEELNVYLTYGTFIQNVIDFLIVAFSIFMIVKAINTMKAKLEVEEKKPVEEAPKKSDELLALEEIVSILKEKKAE